MLPGLRLITRVLIALAAATAILAVVYLVRFAVDRFAYASEDVDFDRGEARVVGTVVRPRSGSSLPGVVLIHGPGPEDRSRRLEYARMFARHGFAALLYEAGGAGAGGGAGGEPGETREADLQGLSGDAVAAVRYLRAREDVEAYDVGLLAVGPGCRVAPLAAVRAGHLAFMVQVSASVTAPAHERSSERPEQLKSGTFEPVAALSEISVPAFWIFGDPALDDSGRVRPSIEALNELVQGGKDYRISVYPGLTPPLDRSKRRFRALWHRGPVFEKDLFAWLGTHIGAPGSSRRMIGMLAYVSDAGLFTDCLSGRRLPVANEADNPALEREYRNAAAEPVAPVLVTLEGRVAGRPAADGGGVRDYLVVARFLNSWPGETCKSSAVETPLVNTYWKLIELDGEAVETHADQPEVHLILEGEDEQIRGFAGCNRFFGDYEVDGSRLSIGHLASTMSACPYLDEEVAFFGALENVVEYEIVGESLELRDSSGARVRFRAVYLE
jgi:heat shock protein HslJ/dienelactone hydrolase